MTTEPSFGLSSPSLRELTSRAEGWERRLETLRQEAIKGDPQAREKVAREFESFFIHYLFKVMREAVPKGGLLGDGQEEELYTSMLDQELAKRMADRGGLGLAELIRKGMMETADSQPPDAGSPPPAQGQTPASEGAPAHPMEGNPVSALSPSSPFRLAFPVTEPLLRGFRIGSKGGELPVPPSGSLLPQEHGPGGLRWPLEGRVSSPFGARRDPWNGQARSHQGIDLVNAPGSEIRAAAPGEVVFSGEKGGYGKTVILQHGGYQTLYAHNLANLVKVGDKVQAGQSIALLGDSGRSTGPHLHFEIRREGEAVDPLLFLQTSNTAPR